MTTLRQTELNVPVDELKLPTFNMCNNWDTVSCILCSDGNYVLIFQPSGIITPNHNSIIKTSLSTSLRKIVPSASHYNKVNPADWSGPQHERNDQEITPLIITTCQMDMIYWLKDNDYKRDTRYIKLVQVCRTFIASDYYIIQFDCRMTNQKHLEKGIREVQINRLLTTAVLFSFGWKRE